jgi:hypothetical protein
VPPLHIQDSRDVVDDGSPTDFSTSRNAIWNGSRHFHLKHLNGGTLETAKFHLYTALGNVRAYYAKKNLIP